MKIKITGKGITVTAGMEAKVREKLEKLDKYGYLKEDTVLNVIIRTVKDDQIVEVTTVVDGKVIRGEKRDRDLYVAIDLVEEVMARKIRKSKERRTERWHKRDHAGADNVAFDEVETDEKVVKVKEVELKPQTIEDATQQMEMLGHDFHLFINADTGKYSVVYKRKDSDYGLITEA